MMMMMMMMIDDSDSDSDKKNDDKNGWMNWMKMDAHEQLNWILVSSQLVNSLHKKLNA